MVTNKKTVKKNAPKKVASKSNSSKKTTRKKPAALHPVQRAMGLVDSIKVRMYRGGTGDCFLLQFQSGGAVTMNMMIDCGMIQAGAADFIPWIDDLWKETGGTIEVLVVTHQHADHINGFKLCRDRFDAFTFQKVWFAWTEDEDDALANDLRQNHTAVRMALHEANRQLVDLVNKNYYVDIFQNIFSGTTIAESKKRFVSSLDRLNSLNLDLRVDGTIPSMVQLFKSYHIIKEQTEVAFLSPGDLLKHIPGAEGIRIFVLGPPRDAEQMSILEMREENYEKREDPSTRDLAFAMAVSGDTTDPDFYPFDHEYELQDTDAKIIQEYNAVDWQKIDHDWLFSAGSMALRFEGSINNTSLALAIQLESSEGVLLFPGDAEFGNWQSWHNGLQWRIKRNGQYENVNAAYLLNNTVFYKIGHHCSQNGSASRLGVDMMIHENLAAMAPLHFGKIQPGWLNTMPNDQLGAVLLEKTNGRLFFSGDCAEIFPNIKTERVRINKAYEKTMYSLNKAFDGKIFIDYEVKA